MNTEGKIAQCNITAPFEPASSTSRVAGLGYMKVKLVQKLLLCIWFRTFLCVWCLGPGVLGPVGVLAGGARPLSDARSHSRRPHGL